MINNNKGLNKVLDAAPFFIFKRAKNLRDCMEVIQSDLAINCGTYSFTNGYSFCEHLDNTDRFCCPNTNKAYISKSRSDCKTVFLVLLHRENEQQTKSQNGAPHVWNQKKMSHESVGKASHWMPIFMNQLANHLIECPSHKDFKFDVVEVKSGDLEENCGTALEKAELKWQLRLHSCKPPGLNICTLI